MITETEIHQITILRHNLHRCAELSMKEYRTKEMLIRFIRDHTSLEIYDEGSWFYCLAGGEKQGEIIAFRAEMDALPMEEGIPLSYSSENRGISHKCGHDGHAACLCGFALVLNRQPPTRPVCLVFQPGEETGEGGKICADFLGKMGVKEIYAFHNRPGYPQNTVVIRHGLTQPASEGLRLHFTGRTSHASEPEKGINPSDAIAQMILFVKSQRTAPHHGMLLSTIVGIKAGTGDFGISAGEGTLSLTLRAEKEEEMTALEKKLISFAGSQAKETGLDFTWEIFDAFPETRNEETASKKVVQAARRAGIQVVETEDLWRASEDFGHYTKKIPGAMFYIGAGENAPALHTREYDFEDQIIETAVRMMLELSR